MVSNEWSSDDFGDGESFPCCVIEWCEHNIDLSEVKSVVTKGLFAFKKKRRNLKNILKSFYSHFMLLDGW